MDDEPLARERLRMLLAGRTGFEVVGECHDGPATIDAIRRSKPDLVFLDVQMPGANGFDVIDAVGAERDAVRDLRHRLRPLRAAGLRRPRARLPAEAVRSRSLPPGARPRAAAARAPSNGDLERRLLALVKDLKPAPQRLERFVVKSGGRVFFVRTDEIDWIEAAGNYVKLHVGTESHLFRETMNAVEAQLPRETFFRIHRSHIVNIERVRELQPWFNGEYVVFLKNGARLTLSRGYREKLQDRIGRPL